MERDFPQVGVFHGLGMQDVEADGITMEAGELGGHVVLVDEEPVERRGNPCGGNPRERGVAEFRTGEDRC